MVEIKNYITREYYELLKITKRITKGHQLSEDLLHEVFIQVLSRDNIILNSYDDNSIKYYLVAIIRMNWISTTSPFHYKIKRENLKYCDFPTNFEIPDDQFNWEKEHLLQSMEMAFTDLNFFQKGILELYLVLGSVSKVAIQTGIPKSSIIKKVRQTKDDLKLKTLNIYNNQ